MLNIARYATRSLISLDDLDTLTGAGFGGWVGQRTERGQRQEEATRAAVAAAGYRRAETPGRGFDPLGHLAPGSFASRARSVGGASMDVPCRVRLGHPSGIEFVAVECKESNSAINSRKRLFEVSDKRTRWDAQGACPTSTARSPCWPACTTSASWPRPSSAASTSSGSTAWPT